MLPVVLHLITRGRAAVKSSYQHCTSAAARRTAVRMQIADAT